MKSQEIKQGAVLSGVALLLIFAIFAFFRVVTATPSISAQESLIIKIESGTPTLTDRSNLLSKILDDTERSDIEILVDVLHDNSPMNTNVTADVNEHYLSKSVQLYHIYRNQDGEIETSIPYSTLGKFMNNTGTGELHLVDIVREENQLSLFFFETTR